MKFPSVSIVEKTGLKHVATSNAYKHISYWARYELIHNEVLIKGRIIHDAYQGGGPGAVVTAAGKSEITGSNTALAFKFQRNKCFLLADA